MKRKKKIGILIVLFCLFCAVFLFSGYQLISNMAKNKAAADAYQELRTEFRSSEQRRPRRHEETGRGNEKRDNNASAEFPSSCRMFVSVDFFRSAEINPV